MHLKVCVEDCSTDTKLMHTACTVCIDFDGHIYRERDIWNPYYPGFGRVDCLTCTCVVSIVPTDTAVTESLPGVLHIQGGNAKCDKDPCPEVPYCEPGEPVPDIVLCCLECKPSKCLLTHSTV